MMIIGAGLVVAPFVLVGLGLLSAEGFRSEDPPILAMYGLLAVMGAGLLFTGYRMATFRQP